jgi:hypothetical protein
MTTELLDIMHFSFDFANAQSKNFRSDWIFIFFLH